MASLTGASSSSTNLGQLAPITTAATALSGLVLAVPQFINGLRTGSQYTIGYQPGNPPPPSLSGGYVPPPLPPAFQFDYEGEQSVALTSDITDHYIEDNTAIQDQISRKPEIISTHGFVGELNDVPPLGLAQLQQAANAVSTIGAYAPQVSLTAQIAYQTAFQLYQIGTNAVNSGISAYSSIISGQGGEALVGNGIISNVGLRSQSKQQIAFQKFYGYWQANVLFTVQTPWAVFVNCAIQSLRAIQDSDTGTVTDFEVTFKVIRTATTAVTAPIAAAGSPANYSSLPQNAGDNNLSVSPMAATTNFQSNTFTSPGIV